MKLIFISKARRIVTKEENDLNNYYVTFTYNGFFKGEKVIRIVCCFQGPKDVDINHEYMVFANLLEVSSGTLYCAAVKKKKLQDIYW